MVHEESCQSRAKTIAGDLLPAESAEPGTIANEEQKEAKSLRKPSTMQINTPLITPE